MFKFLNRSEKTQTFGLSEANQIRLTELKKQLQGAESQLAAFPNSEYMSRKVLLLTDEINRLQQTGKNAKI